MKRLLELLTIVYLPILCVPITILWLCTLLQYEHALAKTALTSYAGILIINGIYSGLIKRDISLFGYTSGIFRTNSFRWDFKGSKAILAGLFYITLGLFFLLGVAVLPY